MMKLQIILAGAALAASAFADEWTYRTPYGVIRSEWKYADDGTWNWTYEIPAGTTARVRLPDGSEKEESPGVHVVTCR